MASLYGTVTRLTGLASGMDTDSIVKNMMQIEQLKVNRELRQRTLTQWRQDALNSIANDFKEFKNTYMSALGSKNMLNSNNYVRYNATTTDTSGTVTVTATSTNQAREVRIDGVYQLAEAAGAQSWVDSATNKGSVLTGTLPDGNYVQLGSLNFSNKLQFDENGNFSFQINDQQFTFNRTDTLQDMITKVSNDEKAGVVMNFSRLTNTFSITAKETGEGSRLEVGNITGNAFGTNGAFKIGQSEMWLGQDAILSVNGVTVTQSSNSFTVDGMSFTLNKTTLGATYENGKVVTDADPIVYTFEKDVQGAVDKIKEFVEGYNTMIRKLEQMVHERKSTRERNYTPLTDEEKASMTEKQIEDWEAIAKKGLFTNDQGITGVINQLRSALFDTVSSAGISPAQLGLKTGSYFDGKLGEIELDETQLRSALEKDADQVMRAFMNFSSSEDSSVQYKENGLIYRIQNIMDGYTKETQAVTLDGISRSLKEYDEKIAKLEERMAEYEESLYMKFAAMESAMAELQNQTTSLVNMLSSGK